MADFTKRFRRDQGTGTNVPPQPGGNVAVDEQEGTRHDPPAAPPPAAERSAPPAAERSAPPAAERSAPPAAERFAPPPATAPYDVRARQRDAFGGMNWGAAFFGWLVAIGLGALLTSLVVGAGAAVGLTDAAETTGVETIGLGGGILLLVVSLIAYYSGGYVAGRMSRFDGARQGFGVWLLGLIITVGIAAAGWIFGDRYNILDRLDLPRIPSNASDLTTGGLIVLGAIALGTLVAAVVGGTVGRRYHDKVDRVGFGRRA